jgi:hypothetical protein
MIIDFVCFFLGHKYVLAQELSKRTRRMYCDRCRKSFAMNDDTRTLLPWDSGFHRMYESHGVPIVYLSHERG